MVDRSHANGDRPNANGDRPYANSDRPHANGDRPHANGDRPQVMPGTNTSNIPASRSVSFQVEEDASCKRSETKHFDGIAE